jgi:hypothetical protein
MPPVKRGSVFAFILALLVAIVSPIIADVRPANAITRGQAISIVTAAIIDTSAAKETLSGFAFQSPTLAGSVIAQRGTTLAIAPVTGWFFWLDMSPASHFSHPTKFILVNDATGAIEFVIDGDWWPTVNGVPQYNSSLERQTTLDLFWRPGGPFPKQSLFDSSFDLQSRLEGLELTAAGSWGIIICPYDSSKDKEFAADIRCAKTSFATLGASGKAQAPVPVVVNKNKADICAAIEALPDECTKLYVFWTGHGTPDTLWIGDTEFMTSYEFACKLQNQKAKDYCLIVEACYSGSYLDELAQKGISGFHMMATDALTPSYYSLGSPFVGSWFPTYVWDCILGGKTGLAAFTWGDSLVRALKDSLQNSPDSLKWRPITGSNPTAGYVHKFGSGGTGMAGDGEPFEFKVAAGCSTVCINFPGSILSDTCGNFTLSCKTGTGWTKVGTYNWNLGKTIYFRTYDAPGATGEYKVTMHSNKGGVRMLVTWLGGTTVPVTPVTTSAFNGHSVGWVDSSAAEFNATLGQGSNGFWSFFWNDGLPLNQIPAHTGPNWFNHVQATLPLVVDEFRPQLYINNDPMQGYLENTVIVFQAASLSDPFGGPADSAQVNAQAFQPSIGFIGSFGGTFRMPGGGKASTMPGNVLVWNMGTIRPEPLQLDIMVFGSGVVGWDAIMMVPRSAIGTSVDDAFPADVATKLYENAPNPFTPGTTIRFTLGAPSHVRLAVYDVAGRLIRTILSERRPGGPNSAYWNGATDEGIAAPSGVYIYRIETPTTAQSRKMTLVR